MNERARPRFHWKYRTLLGSMLLLGFGSSLISHKPVLRILFAIFFFAALVAGIFALSGSRRFLRMAWTLVGISLILHCVSILFPNPYLEGLRALFAFLFFVAVAWTILEHIFQSGEINEENIVGAICVYFILGICWALIYSSIEVLAPNSFDFGGEEGVPGATPNGRHLFGVMVYFSFVTLTTLGYGDITPVSALARAFCSLEALTGQIYLAVIIAGLVGIHISNRILKRTG